MAPAGCRRRRYLCAGVSQAKAEPTGENECATKILYFGRSTSCGLTSSDRNANTSKGKPPLTARAPTPDEIASGVSYWHPEEQRWQPPRAWSCTPSESPRPPLVLPWSSLELAVVWVCLFSLTKPPVACSPLSLRCSHGLTLIFAPWLLPPPSLLSTRACSLDAFYTQGKPASGCP